MTREIRMARPDDAEGCLEIYRPLVEETAISFELEPPGVATMRDRIGAVLTRYPWLVAVNGDEIEGYTCAGAFRNRPAYGWTAETAVYVHSTRRGLGIGRALASSMIECLRLQRFRCIVAVVALPNPASIRLHQAVGYRSVGVFHDVGWKLGRWHDTAWHQLDLAGKGTAGHGAKRQHPAPLPTRTPAEVDPAEWRAAVRSGQALFKG